MTTFLLISLSLHSHQQLHVASPPQQAHPGAFPVRGSRITPQHDSFLNGENNPATLFNAELVVDSELASSASLVDVEAEETAQSLFGFLAEHSFDNGTALSTTGSSQKRHLQGWRSKSTLYNSATDYVVLQFYVLAVFNYATGDLLSGESWLHDNGTASEYNFCDRDNTDCNDGRTDITPLSPLGSQLFGSLTPEIACCLIIP